MFDSTIVDVAIGLIFVYLVVALICTALNELIAQLVALRAKKLEAGIRRMLSEGYASQLYDHPLISRLSRPGLWNKLFSILPKRKSAENRALPSYIPGRLFTTALLDIIAPVGNQSRSVAELRSGIDALPDGDLKRALRALLDNADDTIDSASESVERWFDDVMSRVSGQYKRHIQIITLLLGILLSGLLNADSLALARRLSQDDALRAATVALAEDTIEQIKAATTPSPTSGGVDEIASAAASPAAGEPSDSGDSNQLSLPEEQIQQLLTDTESLGLPLGWTDEELRPDTLGGWATKLLGIAFTAVAVSLGAPFWFDLLGKFVHVRAAGPKPDDDND